jgi:RNA polymerase sigma-70 factor, ECF subfamily
VRFVRSRVPMPQDVDDVYQETLLALHGARHTYQPLRPVEPWLFAIAGHVAARHMRHRRTRTATEVLVDVPPDGEMDHGAEARFQWAEALDRLPRTHREAIELVKLRGLSTAAAAAHAGTTPGAFRVRAHRAYKALRQLLGR